MGVSEESNMKAPRGVNIPLEEPILILVNINHQKGGKDHV